MSKLETTDLCGKIRAAAKYPEDFSKIPPYHWLSPPIAGWNIPTAYLPNK